MLKIFIFLLGHHIRRAKEKKTPQAYKPERKKKKQTRKNFFYYVTIYLDLRILSAI
jgi:hypothetical protein